MQKQLFVHSSLHDEHIGYKPIRALMVLPCQAIGSVSVQGNLSIPHWVVEGANGLDLSCVELFALFALGLNKGKKPTIARQWFLPLIVSSYRTHKLTLLGHIMV